MLTVGYDIGSSSIKAALYDVKSGEAVASATYPKDEMRIDSPKPGWAEQNPETWWNAVKKVSAEILSSSRVSASDISAIGITYQMHGLVLVDKRKDVLRPSIIWCDSRAVGIGSKAFAEIGKEKCLRFLLNSPGNFTASKLRWVIENERSVFEKTFKFMLPGDYIAMKMTGEISTTAEGLSEGIMWNFESEEPAHFLMAHLGISEAMIPGIVPVFGHQGTLTKESADELGLKSGIPITYRAGDQPNNAFSLNVLRPGEIAATAGTSGVVYGVSDQIKFDRDQRVNTFAHVNHTKDKRRLGILLCINGTGISNSWMRKTIFDSSIPYEEMNRAAGEIRIGSDGLVFLPFGNGAERMLTNLEIGASFSGLNFNIHSRKHLTRSVLEGVAFSFYYGINILKELGVDSKIIRAGMANMFLSKIFRETIASLSGAVIQLYNTDGALGAARASAFGAGFHPSLDESFRGLECLMTVEPDSNNISKYKAAYEKWLNELQTNLQSLGEKNED
ncbi:MAG TPA: FGGY family carbohydrate kinase [Candidatus Acidoferrales bacterium]|nr:FGGY family carbohydrate kinase [Candidatus Acidoferrales bacterium]